MTGNGAKLVYAKYTNNSNKRSIWIRNYQMTKSMLWGQQVW